MALSRARCFPGMKWLLWLKMQQKGGFLLSGALQGNRGSWPRRPPPGSSPYILLVLWRQPRIFSLAPRPDENAVVLTSCYAFALFTALSPQAVSLSSLCLHSQSCVVLLLFVPLGGKVPLPSASSRAALNKCQDFWILLGYWLTQSSICYFLLVPPLSWFLNWTPAAACEGQQFLGLLSVNFSNAASKCDFAWHLCYAWLLNSHGINFWF